jgi:predicted heme/steroid binding protein
MFGKFNAEKYDKAIESGDEQVVEEMRSKADSEIEKNRRIYQEKYLELCGQIGDLYEFCTKNLVADIGAHAKEQDGRYQTWYDTDAGKDLSAAMKKLFPKTPDAVIFEQRDYDAKERMKGEEKALVERLAEIRNELKKGSEQQ